jgi:aspartate kinase
MKFGGTSVADAAAFENVADIVAARIESQPVIVVSAMSGMTDALVVSRHFRTLVPLFERHERVAQSLLDKKSVKEFCDHLRKAEEKLAHLLEQINHNPTAVRDDVLSFGEQLSSELLARVLVAKGVSSEQIDARKCIVTDEQHGAAAPLIVDTFSKSQEILQPLLDSQVVPVLGGFIGSSKGGITTTLGRGGSDYSAALI